MQNIILPTLLTLSTVFTLAGCGFECALEERQGTYLMSLEESPGGTCGPVSDMVVVLNDEASSFGVGCVIESQSISEDQCQLHSQITCVDSGNRLVTEVSGTTLQEAAGADQLSGVMTFHFRDLDTGVSLCTSTYNVVYLRQ